ncbi:MAG: sigma-70 family RNA polymerase sigma factor [Myxococcota bacterium]
MLMDAYGPAVLRYCERMLGDLERARDVRQIVFLQAYEGLGHFEGRSSLRTWLFGIARHRSLDAIKSARVRRHEPIDSTAPTRDDPSPSADVRALAVQRAIIECLQRLERGVREAVLLRCQDGFSFPELGRMLGARAGTIEARVRRGTQRLRRCLEHHEVRP